MNDRPNDNRSQPRRGLSGLEAQLNAPGVPELALSNTVRAADPAAGAKSRLRRVLPDIYFVNTPDERAERHEAMIARLQSNQSNIGRGAGASANGEAENCGASTPLLEFYSAPGLPLSECVLCAHDEDGPGLLSKLCGTMAALGLSIHTAFIYTLRDGSATASELERPIVLDTFLVSESYFGHDRALTLKTQKKLRAEMCRVLSGQASVPQLLFRARRALAPVEIHDLVVENRPHEEHTRVALRASDTFGVLYRAASSLSALGLDIRTAQVSTREAHADDLFFVSDKDGRKLPDIALPTVAASLRALLQDEAPPSFDSR
jgi:type IV secretory pathway protease TraF